MSITNAKKISNSRKQAFKRIRIMKKKMQEESEDPKAKAKMEKLALKAEERRVIVLNVPTDCIFPDAIRTRLVDMTNCLNSSSFIIDEILLSNMGRLLFGVEMLKDNFFSEIPDYAQQVEKLDTIIMNRFNVDKLSKKELKLKAAYAALKETLICNYNNISESQKKRLLNNEMKFMNEYRFSLLSEEEKRQHLEDLNAAAEMEKMEREAAAQKLREERLAELQKEEQDKIAKEIARQERNKQKEISRQEALSEYLSNPDDFWNTPDPVKPKSRRRTTRTRK